MVIKSRWRAELLLLVCAVIWGMAFVAQRSAMREIGPLTFTGIRFLFGGLLLAPTWCMTSQVRRPHGLFGQGLLLGIVLFGGASLQQLGLVWTSAAKASFITGLYVVIVPLLGWLIGRRPGWAGFAGAGLAMAGLYLLCGITDHHALTLAAGDGYVLACAPLLALHVMLVDRAVRSWPPLPLASLQFLTCGLLALLVAPWCNERWPDAQAWIAALPELLYGGALSVGVAYTLQVVAQRDADPTHAAIIMSLESPVGAFGGWWLLGEQLTARQIGGALLMLVAMVQSALWSTTPDRLRDTHRSSGVIDP
jgi:drug/metabolite transporter (DMT)-like permease